MATNTLQARITFCVKTASEWAASTTVLLKGEIGIESDTLKCKVGDGTKAWNAITDYVNVTPAELATILADYAKLNSPNFTGVPTAPTAEKGSGTTQIANTSFVKTAIADAFDGFSSIDYQKYDTFAELPTEGAKGVIYLVPDTHSDSNDSYDEYMWFNNAYEKIGNTDVDLSNYQTKITGAATTITDDNLDASKALISNAEGKVAASTVTSTELGYLAGVTSNVQTQLDNKAAKDHTHSVLIKGGAAAAAVSVGEDGTAELNITNVSTSVLAVPDGDTLVLDGNF